MIPTADQLPPFLITPKKNKFLYIYIFNNNNKGG